jgi:prevent-host-death family protein
MSDGHKRGVWSVADAKAQLSRLITQAGDAPQIIESRGKEVAAVLSPPAYASLLDNARSGEARGRWLAFLELSANLGGEDDLRIRVPPREKRASPFAPARRR